MAHMKILWRLYPKSRDPKSRETSRVNLGSDLELCIIQDVRVTRHWNLQRLEVHEQISEVSF